MRVLHDIPVIMDISDKIVVLDFGRKIAEGTPNEVQANEAVIAAYLGTNHGGAVDAEPMAAMKKSAPLIPSCHNLSNFLLRCCFSSSWTLL